MPLLPFSDPTPPTTDASLLTSGTLADARLSSNVALDNQNNSFTAGQSITASANTSALTATYSVTGANTTPLLDLSGTWNTTGVATGIKLNITDTASNGGSLLADFRVGGVTQFSVSKNLSASATSPQLRLGTLNSGFSTANSALYIIGNGNVGIAVNSSSTNVAALGLTSSVSSAGADLFITRDAANTLALRNGTNAQTFRLYNTYTDASNYERGFMRWNSNVLEIGTEAGGTGTGRAFDLYSSGTLSARFRGSTYATLYVGMEWTFSSLAADPTTTDVPSTRCRVIKNTTTGVVKLWLNDGGTLKSVTIL
jgi:hypothetical protein